MLLERGQRSWLYSCFPVAASLFMGVLMPVGSSSNRQAMLLQLARNG